MKNLTINILFIACLFTSVSCDDGFDELNRSKTGVTALDPATVLNQATLSTVQRSNALPLEMAYVQQIVTPNSGVLAGGNYNQVNVTLTPANWDNGYLELIKHAVDVINTTEGDPERSNLYNMARIIKAYGMMIITDTHGDAPYTEAALGYLGDITTPKYDSQASIYTDILNELQEASTGLNASGKIETTDILYGGDITKWKRMGFSLLLRAAMRVADVDPSMAGPAITAAINGGLMQSNDDNFVLYHDSNYPNQVAIPLTSNESANYYMTGEFVDHLKNTNDPRLASMAVRYIGAESGTDQNNALAGTDPSIIISTDPSDQFGLPMGLDNELAAIYANNNGFASHYDFTQVDRTRMVRINAPSFMITFAQTQLLLAEAIVRNLGGATGDVNALFTSAIRANMEVISTEYVGTTIDQTDIDTYVAANNIVPGTELEQINTEYWISSFLNGPEAWANFRRSDYPALSPNPYPFQDITGDFVTRLPYPISELSANKTNLDAALSAQGFDGNDDMDTKLWWDVN
ncbi:MAG: SusD/RagB family nutrient-binding outer membrane lipoprotein [Bacteroidota bacterium]